jgi:hypothetical protein
MATFVAKGLAKIHLNAEICQRADLELAWEHIVNRMKIITFSLSLPVSDRNYF